MSLTGLERGPNARPQTACVKWRNRVLKGIGGMLLVVIVRDKYEELQDSKHRVAMPIVARPYVWPEGCEDKKYNQGDSISSKCESNRYYMGTDRKYYWREKPAEGLNNSARSRRYYRVGDDALYTDCFSFSLEKMELDRCIVASIVRRVFEVKADVE